MRICPSTDEKVVYLDCMECDEKVCRNSSIIDIPKAKRYIHYGSRAYDPAQFEPIRNVMFSVKPTGGLWASAVDAAFGWKEWNDLEDFAECDPETRSYSP